MERPQPVRNERARTNELDADERWRIMGGEEDRVGLAWLGQGRVLGWCGPVGVVSQAPIRRRA